VTTSELPLERLDRLHRLYQLLGPTIDRIEHWSEDGNQHWMATTEDRFTHYDRYSWQTKPLAWWRTWSAGSQTRYFAALGGRRIEDVCRTL